MQVSPVAPPPAAAMAGHAGLLLLPDLFNIASLSPQARALRQQRQADQDDDDRRRRADAAAQQTPAVANADSRPKAVQLAAEAEREMAPGSRAARQCIASQQQQKLNLQSDAFQRTLADATARENASAARPNVTVAGETEDKGQATGSSTPQATSATKSAPTSGQPSQFSTPAAAVAAESAPSPTATVPAETRQVAAVATPMPAAASVAANATLAQNSTAISPLAAAISGVIESNSPQATPAAPGVTAVSDVTGVPSGPGRTAVANYPTAPSPRDTGKTDPNFERILRVLRAQISQNRSQTTLQLDPPELGKIRLHLDLREDALRLRVEPHTDVAYRLLSGQLDSLRDGLHATGLRLEHVDIRPPDANAAPDAFDLPPHSGGGNAGGGAEADTDHPQQSGTDSPAAGPSETAAREANLLPQAEPRVNVWA